MADLATESFMYLSHGIEPAIPSLRRSTVPRTTTIGKGVNFAVFFCAFRLIAPSSPPPPPLLWFKGGDVSPFAAEDTDIASITFGQQDQTLAFNIPSGETLTGGLKITLNGMTKLVLGDGKSKSTIKLAGAFNGDKLTYRPGSGTPMFATDAVRPRSYDKYDVNCRTNWVLVEENGDIMKGPNGGVQYPTKGMYKKAYSAIFNNEQNTFTADGSSKQRPSGGSLFATKSREASVSFMSVSVGDDEVQCQTTGSPPVVKDGNFGAVTLDLGMCNKKTSSEGGVSIGSSQLDGHKLSSCEYEAKFTIGDDSDEELFKVGDEWVLINGDGEGQAVTPSFTDEDGNEVDQDEWVGSAYVEITVDGTTYKGPHGRGADAITTSSTSTTPTTTTVTTKTEENDDGEDGDDKDDDDDKDDNGPDASTTPAGKSGGNSSVVIAVVVVILLLVIAAAFVYVKKAGGGGGGGAAAGGVVSFENPMYDDAKGQTNPTYAQAGGAQGQSGYMDVPAGGAPEGGSGYMDVSPNAGGGGTSGYMDVGGAQDQGGAGYMDVSPNAGGSSGYMDVGGAGDGGYMDGSDGEEDV